MAEKCLECNYSPRATRPLKLRLKTFAHVYIQACLMMPGLVIETWFLVSLLKFSCRHVPRIWNLNVSTMHVESRSGADPKNSSRGGQAPQKGRSVGIFKLTRTKTSGGIQELFKGCLGSSKRQIRRNFQTNKQEKPPGVNPLTPLDPPLKAQDLSRRVVYMYC